MSCTFSSRALIDRSTLKHSCSSRGCACRRVSTFKYARKCCTPDDAPDFPSDSTDGWIEFPLVIRSADDPQPTKATTTTIDKALYNIQGKTMHLKYVYTTGNPGTANDGNGAYLFDLPSGFDYEILQLETLGSAFGTRGNTIYSGTAISDGATSILLVLVDASVPIVGIMNASNNPLSEFETITIDATVRLQ